MIKKIIYLKMILYYLLQYRKWPKNIELTSKYGVIKIDDVFYIYDASLLKLYNLSDDFMNNIIDEILYEIHSEDKSYRICQQKHKEAVQHQQQVEDLEGN